MSEYIPKSHENTQKHEHEPNPYGESRPQQAERHDYTVEKAPNKQEIEELLKKVESRAESSEELKSHTQEHSQAEQGHHYGGSQVKSHSSKQTLKKVQQQLSKPERQFSKVVHNPTVEAVSELTGATVARPSGLLTGGIFSLLSSIGVLFVCRFYGYEYNYFIGIIFFIGGFFLGLMIELAMRAKHVRH